MTIKLYNTKVRKKVDLTPIDAKNVRMYVCGPTVYDRAHLGNARPVIVFDVLNRLLRHTYGADHVTYVRNFTDVDDKINATALARRAAGAEGTMEELIAERSNETIAWYHADMDAVGALRPDHEPRATQYISEMQDMIGELLDKKFAYTAASTLGHNSNAKSVYLDSEKLPEHAFLSVDSFAELADGFEYGDLSRQSVDDMVAGSRAEVGEGKRNPVDSVLWKPSTIEQPGWDSPWGVGRPGWHIECSAMSRKLLGKSFDIHGGGLDLMFPHHENELAQCRACDGADASADIWMHNEMLQVEGKKMSKSLGNFFTVRDLLDQGVPGEVIRFVMLSTHYRKPMDWTEKKREEAEKTLNGLTDALDISLKATGHIKPTGAKPSPDIITSLGNDLDTHRALKSLRASAKVVADVANATVIEGEEGGAAIEFLDGLVVLGFFELLLARRARRRGNHDVLSRLSLEATLRYNLAKQTGNFNTVDDFREKIIDAGVAWEASRDGISLTASADVDVSKLQKLL